MKKQRIYIHTLVFGGYINLEFETFIKLLFERIMNEEFIVLYSTGTQEKLENAPQRAKELVSDLKVKDTVFTKETDGAVDLA